MNFVRLFPTPFYGIMLLFMTACSNNNEAESQVDIVAEVDKADHSYRAFDNFPNDQFKTFCLGESKKNLENQIANMPVELLAEEEVSYFYFPADSSEMILPMDITLHEFKVFLKGDTYLKNSNDFNQFLSEKAIDSDLDENFPVYYYETDSINFKMTYFKQERSIRLHFMMQ